MLAGLALGFWCLVVYLLMGHGRVPRGLRRSAPSLGLAVAIAAFGAAPLLRGTYTQEVALFIGGPNAHTVETVEGSFAELAVGLGIIALALAAVARWGGGWFGGRPLARALALTVGVLLLRIALEKLGVPLAVAVFVGVIWLVVPLPVYFAIEAARAGSQGRFWGWLLAYAVSVRLLVVVLMLGATRFELGTHFDNSSITRFQVLGQTHVVEAHSWQQYVDLILLPQLLLWTGVTVVAGIVFGWPAWWVAQSRRRGVSGTAG